MSIEIKITIPDEDVYKPEALQQRMLLLGYAPNFYFSAAALTNSDNAPVVKGDDAPAQTLGEAIRAEEAKPPTVLRDPAAAVYHELAKEPAKEPAKRGRPKKAEAAAPTPEQADAIVAEAKAVQETSEPAPAIRTSPEHRVDPEVEAQDAEDEAAEAAAAPAKEATAEDLRAVMGRYVAAHGIAAAQEDGPKLFVDALGPAPAGAETWTITLASQNPETLAKAVAAWEAAVAAGGRYGRS